MGHGKEVEAEYVESSLAQTGGSAIAVIVIPHTDIAEREIYFSCVVLRFLDSIRARSWAL